MLFNVLLQIKRPAYTQTRTTSDEHGFDTLRLLIDQFGKSTRVTMLSKLMSIFLQKVEVNNLIAQRTDWEFGISYFEGVTVETTTRVAEHDVAGNGD